MSALDSFLNQFKFSESLVGYVAVEIECYITDLNGVVIPRGHDIGIELTNSSPLEPVGTFGGDLPRCQLEYRTGPTRIFELVPRLEALETRIKRAEELFGFRRIYKGYLPGVPLDVSPVERYQRIAKAIPVDLLRAACEVAATHVHIGMPNMETAIRAYNHSIGSPLKSLIERYATEERIDTYAKMAQSSGKDAHIPPHLDSVGDLFQLAERLGFVNDLKSWWGLIRITRWGTIEFRMADSTNDIAKIEQLAMDCWSLCLSNLLPKNGGGSAW